ncbi:family 43 glycosylhydrolase [Fulvivirgaceae bacterium PWU4]|uniref:Family 43 glycosylhydrolase n=1 Tax=Chryseosolibacter histidini TaxID=2782349 RepID=A0AAP2DMU4_9BACT|nr:family 43 glycosylhydrolase [Chryseosolibacter histidini]MBT1698128.1 family 43 glycosylhydrolase [Chryseosolibacter histidini]
MKAASIVLVLFLCWMPIMAQTQNPFIRSIYTADPSAHVWADGRLYVYPSHDIDPPRGCDLMDKYHVFSTDDMVHWTDHGEILGAADVDWGRPEGGFMWAPDCAYKNGTYYFYFPHPTGSGDQWNSTWKIGVATSSQPAANFKVQGYIEGLKSMIDPCVFVDDDGQAYLYYGGGGQCEGGKLKDNMMEIDGGMKPMQGLQDFHEGTWVHKYNGKYYLSYADNNPSGGNQLRYAVSNSPLGPWTYKGVYIKPTGSPTNHGSIIEYKGQSYAFYHNSILSGNPWLRSICVDPLFYNEDGTIQLIRQTRAHGTPYPEHASPIPGTIEAEDYDLGGQGKAYSDSEVANNGNAYRKDEGVDVEMNSPGNYNVGWTNGGEWMEYTVNVAENSTYTIKTVAASPNNNSSVRYKLDGNDITGSVMIPNTGGWQNYRTIPTKGISLDAGTHILQLFEETGGFNIDKITIEKEAVITSVFETHITHQVYPNPASTEVTIESPEQDPFILRTAIFDMRGRVIEILDNRTNKDRILLDVSRFNPGCYLLKIYSENTVQVRKLIITRN